MTTEIAKAPKKPIAVGDGGIMLTSLDELFRFGQYVCASGLAPKNFDTPEKVIIAVQWGCELGMSPMQSLQSIAVINGKPSIYGDALPALVDKSGLCLNRREWIEGEGEGMTAYCETLRKGRQSSVVTTFSVNDAKKAQLWGKAGPWQSYPKRMLQIRARAFNFRDQFADALRGMAIVEEVQDIEVRETKPKRSLDDFAEEVIDVTPEPVKGSGKLFDDSEPTGTTAYGGES